jgi:hypothetical protein
MEEELKRINDLHLWDFEIAERDGDTLLILGSNDFVYYHYLEAEFRGVTFTDLPAKFSHAQFRLGKESTSENAVVWIDAEASEFEIQATGLELRIGKVYYYDRKDLQPGERIADGINVASIRRLRR